MRLKSRTKTEKEIIRAFLGREPRRGEEVRFCRDCNRFQSERECACGKPTWLFDSRFVRRFPRKRVTNFLPCHPESVRMPGDYPVPKPVILGSKFEGKR
jgi:hypothetical protein